MNQKVKTAFRDRLATFMDSHVGLTFPELGVRQFTVETDTDVVIVGSSIVHLIKALTLASIGLRVVVLEQRQSLGGVWSTIDTLGLRNVERAPHILMPTARAYKLIENVFETRMSEITPHPIALRVDENCAVITESQFPSSSETRHPDVFYEGPCKHPTNGTNALIERLFSLGRAMGIQFRSDIHVHSLRIDNDQKTTLISKSQEFSAHQVIFSRGSPILQIHSGQSRIVPHRSSNNVSIHLLIKASSSHAFSFVHIDEHPLIKEVHDITAHTPGLELGHRLIIVKLLNNIFNIAPLPILDAQAIFADLKKIGLLGAKDVLLNSTTTGYAQTRILESCLGDLEREFGHVIDMVPFKLLHEGKTRGDLVAQDMSVVLSAPEFYESLLRLP